MIGLRFLSNRSLLGRLIVRGMSCSILALASIGAAQAAFVNFRVEGLPSGLQVGASGQFAVCGSAQGGSQSSGGVLLTEDSYITLERVTLPSGLEVFTSTVHYFYAGTLQITPPANNGCGVAASNALTYEYNVAGTNAADAPTSRTVGSGVRLFSGDTVNIKDTLHAQTTRIAKTSGVPTSLRLGASEHLIVTYEDSAGGFAARNPTIEITRPANINGIPLNVTVARAVINSSNQVCITSGGETVCRSASANGTVTAGLLTVNLNGLRNTSSGKVRTVEWSITINPSLGTGAFHVAARADDFDTISYYVNGDAADIDLLPWKALRIPVSLTN